MRLYLRFVCIAKTPEAEFCCCLGCTWTPKVCRIIAFYDFYGYWAIILLTLGGLGTGYWLLGSSVAPGSEVSDCLDDVQVLCLSTSVSGSTISLITPKALNPSHLVS